MSRFTNPVPQYLDGNGDPLCFGKLYYYDSGTNTLKNTYADSLLTIANTNPVELDAAGRVPPIFYNGSARVVLKDCNNEQIWDRDPVGGEVDFSEWAEWSEFVEYSINDIVEYSGDFYRSLVNANQGVVPVGGPSWEYISFLGLYNASISYSIGDTVKTSGGFLWRSLVSSNLNNDPTTDGGANWLPAIDGSKITEIDVIETRTTTVIPHTGGGALTALRVNELQDGGAYTLPLASSVAANQTITITLPDEFKAFEPVVSRTGADTISYSGGTDTSITFKGATRISLTSDGSTDWRL